MSSMKAKTRQAKIKITKNEEEYATTYAVHNNDTLLKHQTLHKYKILCRFYFCSILVATQYSNN